MGYATYVSKVLRDSPLRANLDNKILRVHENATGEAYPAYIEVPRRPDVDTHMVLMDAVTFLRQNNFPIRQSRRPWIVMVGVQMKSDTTAGTSTTAPLSEERRASLDKALEEGRITIRGHRKLTGKPSPAIASSNLSARVSRDEAITAIRTSLKQRSGKAWSVRGGTGTAYGWITITAPPRRKYIDWMSHEDAKELHQLLGLDFRPGPETRVQHVIVPASSDYYREYVDRAAGRTPSTNGKLH